MSSSAATTSSLIRQAVAEALPDTVKAPEADVVLAKASVPVDKKPEPASAADIKDLLEDVGLSDRGGDHGTSTSSATSTTSRSTRPSDDHGDHDWDHKVRRWDPTWIQYDPYYRPVICNPYRETIKVVYVYEGATRVVFVPPLARVSVEVRQNGAYNFTAVRVNAFGVPVDVSVGGFFGGGYDPGPGLPPPPPPPPVVNYTQVIVVVKYTNVTYRPIRVGRVIDCDYDPRVGHRKLLLDGSVPVWGEWNGTAGVGGTFEVFKTQQFPGLGDPAEEPLPGDYNLQLAAAESGISVKDALLIGGAAGSGIVLVGGTASIVWWRRRQRPKHI